MAKVSGIGHHLFLDSTDLSGDVGSVETISGGRSPLDVTGISSAAHERVHGLRHGELAFNAWWNFTGAHPVIDTMPTADRIATYAAYTSATGTAGDAAASIIGKQVEYGTQRAADGSLMATFRMESNAAPLEFGRLLTTGVQTMTGAANGTSIDRGVDWASTSFGAAAYLHVFAFTGTSAAIVVKDSADNSTFASIGLAFTSVTGTTKERIQTSLTQTVRRYLRVEVTGTFSNLQFAVVVVPYDLSQAT